MGLAAYGKSLVDGVIHDRHLIAIRRSETMAHRKEKAEAEKSIPELANEVTREEMRQMYRDGKLTAYGRRMSKFLERALPDEKVDEWGDVLWYNHCHMLNLEGYHAD